MTAAFPAGGQVVANSLCLLPSSAHAGSRQPYPAPPARPAGALRQGNHLGFLPEV